MNAEIGIDLNKAKNILDSGGLVAIPTETVYGLAANALDQNAVLKIFEAKNRPKFDPLIVHIAAIDQLNKYTSGITDQIESFTKVFWPGPLTILLPKNKIIPDIVTSGLEKVAIRIPNHPLTLALLKTLNYPLAAPSANPFGYVSPTNALHVKQQLENKIAYIIDGGQCDIGLESTILEIVGNKLIVYRKGGISLDQLSANFNGEIEVKTHSSSNPVAPGMLKKHYSPNKKIELYKGKIDTKTSTHNLGFIGFDNYVNGIPVENQFLMSKNGDINEAAQRLFLGLRWLDTLEINKVYVQLCPEIGIGEAINDRLRRSAAKY
jgi:L-threonylcarbamoyladenylate synthase